MNPTAVADFLWSMYERPTCTGVLVERDPDSGRINLLFPLSPQVSTTPVDRGFKPSDATDITSALPYTGRWPT